MDPLLITAPIFCAGFLFFGYLGLKAAFFDLQLIRKAKKWPHVKGELLSVDIAKKRNSSSGSGNPFVYGVKAKYKYTVNGKRYVSDRLNFSELMSSNLKKVNQRAEALIDQDSITVFYDPDAPASSVLFPKISAGTILTITAGVLFSSVGLSATCFYGWFVFLKNG